jgi:pilus assembly protein FimV
MVLGTAGSDPSVEAPRFREHIFDGEKAGVRTLMAFGFGFNKQKVLSAAEKYVQQGKLQNAIAEYEKVLKADPKDLTVLNTVGDLYSRNGEVDKATDCFKKVGDAYAAQGFTVKGIAMYKKIGKLKPSLESVLKLAELYTQQGLFNDARAQYLQVAEEFLRAGELEQSVRIFQKILEMDPENVAMRVRLAEVYIRLGKKNEAWQIFSAAAETLRNRGSRSGAEEILQRMLTLDPGNSYALLLRARNSLESGDAAGAIPLFQKVHDLDNHPDGMRDLLKAYLQTGRVSESGPLAGKLLTLHNDTQAMFSFVEALVQNNAQDDAVHVIEEYADRLMAENSAKILETLRAVIGPLSGNPESLEKVLALFHKAGDQSHDSEINELLAHASVQSGDLSRARDLYQQLTEQEPQNSIHMQNYQQVVGMMGGTTTAAKLLTVEEGIVLVEELEATAPPVDQQYSPEIANALRAAITDTELFVSYNMPDKALGPLMAVLPIAPSDVRLNQRLAALYVRSEHFADAAACCHTLASVYNEAGLAEEGTRYEELAQRCQERAATTPGGGAATFSDQAEIPLAPWPLSTEEAPEVHAADSEDSVHVEVASEPEELPVVAETRASEIDLSEEWDGAMTTEPAEAAVTEEPETVSAEQPAVEEISAEASGAVAETLEEIRFYLEHSMLDQARAAYVKLQSQTADYEQLAAIQAEIDAAAPAASEVETVEDASDDIPEAAVAFEEPVPTHEEPAHITHESEPATPLQQMVAELDSSLGDHFLPDTVTHEIEQEHEVTAHAGTDPALVNTHEFMAGPKITPKREPEEKPKDAGVLGEFVADLENSLGDSFLQEAPVPTQQPLAAAAMPPTAAPAAAQTGLHMAASAASGAAPHTVPTPPPIELPVAAAAAAPSPVAVPSTFQASVRPANGTPAPANLAASVDLADMFGEIRHELEEEVSTSEEDPETHYNLGVAFREMGLLDEAIGELQKVCQAIDHGNGFPQVMQTYTWLAQCFLDKGVPEAAIRWYEKALALPSLDQETRTALHYELASSYETAQDKNHALQHFMEVYGSNIDYRDVGERIKALKS